MVLLTILSIVGLYSRPLQPQEEVSLSRIVHELEVDNIASIEVNHDELVVSLKNSETKLITQKESDASVTETLRNLGVPEEKLRATAITVNKPSGIVFWISALLPVLIPFLLLAGFLWFMMRSAQSASNRAMTFGQIQARPIEPEKKKRTTFAEVAGNEEAKHELQEVVEFLKNPKKFSKLGARIPKGVLLVGPPGTGKTLMARAVAGEANVPFFNISGSEFVEMFVGVGAARVRDAFRKVKRNAPAILFIDELDAVGRHRGAGLGGGHDEREQTLNQILVEMDGFEQHDQVVVLSATNRPDVLDPALLRPGRFDRQVVMELPDINEREAILKIHVRSVPLAPDTALREIAVRTPGFSGADLANVINEAAILAARRNRATVQQIDLEESIEKVMLGPEKRSKVLSEREKKITAYHEAGHAVAAHYLPHSDRVRKISIVARGHAGGYTLKLPQEDRRLHSRSEFRSDLATLMGGYVAELRKFNELTTGASDDLRRATALARRIVTEFGMSELGPMTFGRKDEYIFLGKELHEARNYSEETATKIDEQIAKFLTLARQQAQEILTKHNDKLELIAQTLIKKETIGQEEFVHLMGGEPEAPPEQAADTKPQPSPSPAGEQQPVDRPAKPAPAVA